MTTLIEDVTVIGGVDTHKHTHYAAVIDEHGRLLGHRQFSAHLSRIRSIKALDARLWQPRLDRGGEHGIIRRRPRSRTDTPR